MLEMVLMKADPLLAKYYEEQLVPDELTGLGEKLRQMLIDSERALLDLRGEELMASQPQNRHAIVLRNPYTDPLNYLQAELLHRVRQTSVERSAQQLERALMITIAGIAAGMRNTG